MVLYISGGRQRRQLVGDTDPEWTLYDRARIIRLNTESLRSETLVDYETPPEARPARDYSILFKQGTLDGRTLYVCTSTEVLVFQVPEFLQSGYVSLPCFNDLHHVCPSRAGSLLVANTGLDTVVECTLAGEAVRYWSVLGGDPWERFSKTVDYRKVATTKPHQAHPNFVFHLDGEYWVTRARHKDAVSLTTPGRRIGVGGETVHDGLVSGDSIYFTMVDGHVVIVDRHDLTVKQTVDLNDIVSRPGAVLGWCRGLCLLDHRLAWVGFTRVRKTKFRENLLWVKHGFRDLHTPTHIALYDLEARRCLQEINLEDHGLNVVFGLFKAS
jgi:hypothetical protein